MVQSEIFVSSILELCLFLFLNVPGAVGGIYFDTFLCRSQFQLWVLLMLICIVLFKAKMFPVYVVLTSETAAVSSVCESQQVNISLLPLRTAALASRCFVFFGIKMIPDSSAKVWAVHLGYHATFQMLWGDEATTVLFVYIFAAVRILCRK